MVEDLKILADPGILYPTVHILCDRGIKANIENGNIQVTDIDESQIQPTSLDLRLGKVDVYDRDASRELVLQYNRLSLKEKDEFQPSDEFAKKYPDELNLPIDIPGNCYCEITFHEDVKTVLETLIDLRSSRGRLGLELEHFDGKTAYVRNNNPNTIQLYGRSPFAQLLFFSKEKSDGIIVCDEDQVEQIGKGLNVPTFGPYLVFRLGVHAYRYKQVSMIDSKNNNQDLYDKVKTDNLYVPRLETIIAQLEPEIQLPPNIAIQLINIPYLQTPFQTKPDPRWFFCEPRRVNAGLIDPGFQGNVTAHLRRTKTDAIYKSGMNVVLGVIIKFHESVKRPYGSSGLNSHYQDSKGSVSMS